MDSGFGCTRVEREDVGRSPELNNQTASALTRFAAALGGRVQGEGFPRSQSRLNRAMRIDS